MYKRQQIYEAVWKEPSFQTEKTVTVHIRRIREKIEINPKEPKYLKAVSYTHLPNGIKRPGSFTGMFSFTL